MPDRLSVWTEGEIVRGVIVFVAGCIASFAALVAIYHRFLPGPSIVAASPHLLWSVIIGGLASRLPWVASRPHIFAAGSFAGGCLVLLPFVVVSYGVALIALPLFVLWALGVWLGIRLGRS